MVSREIAKEFKKTLIDYNEDKMYKQMQKHYKMMRLIDKDGKWATPSLAKISNEILPKDITREKAMDFVDEVARLSEQNPYLENFLERAKSKEFKKFEKKYKDEGATVLPDVVAYSMVLEKLTKAMYNNPQIMEDCLKVFQKAREKEKTSKYMQLFHKVKLHSVEKPVENLFLKAQKTGEVPKDALKYMLPINILEATFGDFVMGNWKNAKAGWRLAVNGPGGNKLDEVTGKGPSSWSKDKKGIAVRMPLPEKWADLYQTWNMAFCAQIPEFPTVLPKLFIPQVAKYHDRPEDYIYNRALALYLHLNHAAFEAVDFAKTKTHSIDWADKKLTRFWGKVNSESAKEYKCELKRVRKFKFNELNNGKDADRKKEVITLKEKLINRILDKKEKAIEMI